MKELIPKEVNSILSKELRPQLNGLVAHARRIQAGRKLLVEEIPVLCGIDMNDRQTEFFKACYGGSRVADLTELVAHVHMGQDKIYSVDFSDRDYPNLGVQKGFTVKRRIRPQEYNSFSDAFSSNSEKWEKVSPDRPEFTTAVGTTLHQLMDRLTESSETDNLGRCLDSLRK